ncbi:syntaxin-17 isoform X2 [Dendropsophus ebraccatus]|uniref:syntaxin-17 isoform X2 n=1 Tax=Dendropsophus ebraccatus TaxID=150705 RepID=UPI0038312E5A
MLESEQKVPYRRLEDAAQKFAKVVIPTDLERLRNHQINIEKYRRCKSWDQLDREHINAGRTVQQLRANMQDMETLFLKVRKEDIQALTKVVQPVKDMALASIHDFLEIHTKSVKELHEEILSDAPNNLAAKEPSCESNSEIQMDVQLIDIQDANASESWNALEKDLLGLNEVINEFSHLVHALNYKLTLLPAAGALLGGIVGGPIGLMAGFKVAGIATAIGGGLLGFTGGKVLQRKKVNIGKDQISSIEYHPQEEKKPT